MSSELVKDDNRNNENDDKVKYKEEVQEKIPLIRFSKRGMGNNLVMTNALLVGARISLKTLKKRKED